MNAHSTFPETSDGDALVRGWTPERKVQFLDHLARKGNVRAACARVRLSREAAYRLRRRDRLFARGWAAALIQAHEASIEVLAERAIDGIEEEVWHRGELVGTRRKYDSRLLLAHIARLDKAAENPAAQADAARFDELLARIGGDVLPGGLDSADGVLPLDREATAVKTADEAEAAYEVEDRKRDAGCYEGTLEARQEAGLAAYRAGYVEGKARFDAWFDNACLSVDYATGWLDEVAPGLPGGPPLPARGEALAGGRHFFPQDSVNVSTR